MHARVLITHVQPDRHLLFQGGPLSVTLSHCYRHLETAILKINVAYCEHVHLPRNQAGGQIAADENKSIVLAQCNRWTDERTDERDKNRPPSRIEAPRWLA